MGRSLICTFLSGLLLFLFLFLNKVEQKVLNKIFILLRGVRGVERERPSTLGESDAMINEEHRKVCRRMRGEPVPIYHLG